MSQHPPPHVYTGAAELLSAASVDLLNDRAKDAADSLDPQAVRTLLSNERLIPEDNIYVVDYFTRRTTTVRPTQFFSVLDVTVTKEPVYSADILSQATEFVHSFESDNINNDDGTGIPLRPLHRTICQKVSRLIWTSLHCVLSTTVSNGSKVKEVLQQAAEKLKLPSSSPLLEACEVVSLGTYVDQICDVIETVVQDMTAGETPAHCATDSRNNVDAASSVSRDSNDDPDAAKELAVQSTRVDESSDKHIAMIVKCGLCVLRRLSPRQLMALLGLRHTKTTPCFQAPPSFAALFAVRSTVASS